MYSLKSLLELVCRLLGAMVSPVVYGVFEDICAEGGGSGLVEEGVACEAYSALRCFRA